jgi:hypothetical protein
MELENNKIPQVGSEHRIIDAPSEKIRSSPKSLVGSKGCRKCLDAVPGIRNV